MTRRWGIWTLLLSLVALVLGFSVGMISSPDDPAQTLPVVELADSTLSIQAEPSSPPAEQTDTRETGRIEHWYGKTAQQDRSAEVIEQRLEFGRILLEGYRAEVEGVVQEWTAELRERFNREKFRDVVDRVQETCDLPGELVGMDCEEPPCIAVFRLNENQVRSSAWYYGRAGTPACETWEKEYTRGMFLLPTLMDCPRGGREWFAVLAPSFYWKGAAQRDIENNGKRILTRAKGIKDKWRCSAP
jgi:hypothetical protein